MVIPSTPSALALDALLLLVDALAKIGAERYRVLLTLVPPRPSRDGEMARATLEGAGLPLFAGEIRRRVAFQKAALEGVPVYDVKDPRAAEAWHDYVDVGEEVVVRGQES